MQDSLNRAAARPRYSGLMTPPALQCAVGYGEVGGVWAPAGSLVQVTGLDTSEAVWITALRPADRSYGLAAFDLPDAKAKALPWHRVDGREMVARLSLREGQPEAARGLHLPGATAEGAYVLRLTSDAHVFALLPMSEDAISHGTGGSVGLQVQLPPGQGAEAWLPEPLGRVVEEIRVDRATARAYTLRAGQFVQIIDVMGQQCSDFMALRADALEAGQERPLDNTVSRTMARGAFPRPGLHDKFYDQDIRPLLAVRQDTVGRHDTFALACTARGYEDRGFPGHVNCSDNISDAFAPYGIARRPAWPAVNFFFNTWIDPAQTAIASDEAWSRPGDHVVMQALTDLVCVSTACPDDIDPINGWNPTDIHLRVYEADTAVRHAVAWRAHPAEAARMTRHSAFHSRTSALTSSYAVARDQWLPQHYDATGAVGEYWATKTAATLQDLSSLLKYDIVGPDAEALLQDCLSRDVARLAVHRGTYALMCNARGEVLDDGTLFRLEPTAFRWCCGSERSAEVLRDHATARGLDARVLPRGAGLPNLALQGPASRAVLDGLVYTPPGRPTLEALRWFGFTIARLGDRDGPLVMLCRTGYTGELGYELFCGAADAPQVWDMVMAAGAPHGLVPMGGAALEMLRIEAGLMAAGAEFGPEIDALEAGLGFAIDWKKPAFTGRDALERHAAAPRRTLVGLQLDGRQAPAHGDGVFVGRDQIGTVTSACLSPQLGHAIAMARIASDAANTGDTVEIGRLDGHMKRLPARIVPLPFLDPQREKPRS